MSDTMIYHSGTGTLISLTDEVYLFDAKQVNTVTLSELEAGLTDINPTEFLGVRLTNDAAAALLIRSRQEAETKIDFEQWVTVYEPKRNHIQFETDPDDSYHDEDAPMAGEEGAFNGCMFETYGEEKLFVQTSDPLTVWTLVEGDDGYTILSGYHLVNRIGHFVTKNPIAKDAVVIIELGE